jgi:hypothetical protein
MTNPNIALKGTKGWWFLNLGYCWLAFYADNDMVHFASLNA